MDNYQITISRKEEKPLSGYCKAFIEGRQYLVKINGFSEKAVLDAYNKMVKTKD